MDAGRVENPFRGIVLYRAETGSTMQDARDFVRTHESYHGIVIVAGFQTAGRGRGVNRSWSCAAGQGLLFTLILDTKQLQLREPTPFSTSDFGSSTLPLRAGLALASALEENYRLAPSVKWPNDVLVENKKIAGILCEAHAAYQLLAMGLNVGAGSVPIDSGLRWPATSLEAEIGAMPPLEVLLSQILRSVDRALEEKNLKTAIEARLFGLGKSVRFNPGADTVNSTTDAIEGRVLGVSESGALLLRLSRDEREICFHSGEISYGEAGSEAGSTEERHESCS
ncbi:MAG TPA: biotin--[acetyl-CoA-carboxylase] ligase [Spirochaetia bacterium]|nr:biotin--[acetyl-CoA-carboxylase] ligase [Spirochaetia bacterium]